MMNSQKYLADAKKKLGISESKQFAEVLELSPGAICHYESGDRIMNDSTALKVAEILEIDPMKVIAAANIDREKGKNKEIWENFYKRLGGIAASIFFAVNLIMTPTPSEAAPVLKVEGSTLYIMLNRSLRFKAIKEAALILVKQITRFCLPIPCIR